MVISSCQGTYLDKKPYSSLDGQSVEMTEKGMELLLVGAYSLLSSQNYYGATLYLYEAAKGPDFFVRNVSGGYSFYTENRYAESSSLNSNAKNLWQRIYSVIRNTTILLENIDNIVGDVANLRRIKGEAYALRGLAYFDLSRLFAYPPKYSCSWGSSYNESFKWGLPLINDVDMGFDIIDYEVRRATADQTWEYIEDQLNKACSLLEGQVGVKGHIDAASALALLIRAKLYMEHNEDVVTLGEQWVAQYEHNYAMLSYDSYPTQYYKSFNSESIWEIKYSVEDNLSSNSLNYWVRRPTHNAIGSELDGKVSQNSGYAKLGLTYGNAINGLENMRSYSADIRRYLICELGIVGKDYYSIRKYVGDPYHFVHNIPVIRLPEIYLSLAEAYYKLDDLDKATQYLTLITSVRRKATANITSVNSILNERRREFILEGQTYWDFFRNGRNISNRPVMESIGSSSTIKFGTITGLSYRTVYPIPLAEMNANPAIRDQQNPGYADWEFGVEEEN